MLKKSGAGDPEDRVFAAAEVPFASTYPTVSRCVHVATINFGNRTRL